MAHRKCQNAFCPNRYDDVIGEHKRKAGGICLPCLYAEQMKEYGQTPEQVESAPELVEKFSVGLAKAGWTWQDIKDSYQRMEST